MLVNLEQGEMELHWNVGPVPGVTSEGFEDVFPGPSIPKHGREPVAPLVERIPVFNPLKWPVILADPGRVASSAWTEHVPFAFFVVACHKPEVLVELGTHHGVSYCAFCQAVDALKLATRCYAVDTWCGDEMTGRYDEEVFRELAEYHASRYSGFSTLLRMPFDEAPEHLDDGTVDLLHIDGCHTYEAVSHDFTTWLPKMSARGVVLRHDTAVRESRFGV